MPGSTVTARAFDRDGHAEWYARRHRDIDDAIVHVFYLPKEAPTREIRLLEVNTMISETTPLEPVDFGVDVDSDDAHTLYVLDVTPAQWEAIKARTMPLPTGWTLDDSQELGQR